MRPWEITYFFSFLIGPGPDNEFIVTKVWEIFQIKSENVIKFERFSSSSCDISNIK